MLTLLLALFIVLFAMNETDVKGFQELAYIFEIEYVGGAGVVENGMTIIPEDKPRHDILEEDDDRPVHNAEFASNWELSVMRPIQFMYLLIEDSKIDPKWFSSKGYGEFRPLLPNTSEDNRAVNHRVEVLIEPNYDMKEDIEKE